MKKPKIIAIDIGGTFIKSALINHEGKIFKREKTPTQAQANTKTILENLATAYEKVQEDDVCGIGLGVPGCVNPQSGKVSAIDNIPALEGISLTEFFMQKTKLPTYIDNDANSATKGEYIFGTSQKGLKNFMAITLGTGVGGGLILDGEFYRGANNYAGEIGHMTYIPDGAPCNCGKRGCLEAYASATAIIRSAKSMIKRSINTSLKDHDLQNIDAKLICDLAKKGDRICQFILHDAAKALGTVLGTVTNLLNLECIVIGGGMAAAGNILFEPLGLYACRHTLPMAYPHCKILPSLLGNDAGLLGCGASVLMEQKKN